MRVEPASWGWGEQRLETGLEYEFQRRWSHGPGLWRQRQGKGQKRREGGREGQREAEKWVGFKGMGFTLRI